MTRTNLTFKEGLVQKLKQQKTESIVIIFLAPWNRNRSYYQLLPLSKFSAISPFPLHNFHIRTMVTAALSLT